MQRLYVEELLLMGKDNVPPRGGSSVNPPPPKRIEIELKIRDHIMEQARAIASFKGISMEEALSIVTKKQIEENMSFYVEQEILKDLAAAWNKFVELDRYHPSELSEFAQAMHTLQQLIGMRILNREHPELFPKK